MVWNPVANFANCIKSRPPLVVFALCLFSFLITAVSLAYYVQHDNIENKDAQEQWLSLIHFIDKTGFCIQDDAADTKTNFSAADKVNINTYAIVTSPITNRTFVQGIVSLKEWSFPCLNEAEKPENIELSFNIHSKDNSDDRNVCVTISGPKQFMPKVDSHVECPISEEKEVSKKLFIYNNAGRCVNRPVMRLEFDSSSINKVESEEYLSSDDKEVIYMHLIATSYFIIFVILVIICYALIRGHKVEQKQDARHLLTGKILHT
ncbi:uncharacterized protein LOC108732230 [Agrilus planipennis]|uniref:Uncharacterized protein LOC108732230 n=1 Tax=Agrilus planipennis TaxID=224129 RepID=A0A7F5QX15_AGRPL|nr:uncharacterized protein LOC108732230 [Agrilus planipennis]